MPAEIDLANAGRVGEQLCTAASPGVTIIVADLTGTQFCDSAGIRTLLRARDDVRRALQAIGVQYVLPVYPTVAAALAPDVPSSRSAQ
jgi:anti-anti-sigma regulatory factor